MDENPVSDGDTVSERSETPRTDELQAFVKLPEDIATHVANLEMLSRTLELEAYALRSVRDAQWTVLKLLFERFPDCACIGDLPGCVDEERLRYT